MSIDEPAPRDLTAEGIDSVNAQKAVSPFVFSSESNLRPQYAQLDLSVMNNILTGAPVRTAKTVEQVMSEHPEFARAYRSLPANDTRSFEEWFSDHASRYPGDAGVAQVKKELTTLQGEDSNYLDLLRNVTPQFQEIQTAAERQQTEADIKRVEDFAPRANEAFRAANPQLTAVRDELINRTTNATLTPIQQEQERQAMAELQRGGQLSADEQRAAINASRNAFAARGMAMSNPSAVAEVLSRDAAVRQRLNEARQYAGAVDTMGLQQRQTNTANLGRTAQIEAGLSIDPFMSILGRPSTAVGAAQGATAGAGAFNNAGPQLFDPFNAYAAQLNADNYGQANQNARANASMTNDLWGGVIGMAGQVGGAAVPGFFPKG